MAPLNLLAAEAPPTEAATDGERDASQFWPVVGCWARLSEERVVREREQPVWLCTLKALGQRMEGPSRVTSGAAAGSGGGGVR